MSGNAVRDYFEALLAHFGPQDWWPGETPWEVAMGAVLTQNTNWGNVVRALDNLRRPELPGAEDIAAMPVDELAPLLRPSGYFNVKARRLHELAAWWSCHAAAVAAGDMELSAARESLLAVRGIGPETADSILLYAFELPLFVIDAYTRRVAVRHDLAPAKATYADLQQLFAARLPVDTALYNEYHALLVAVGKYHCRPRPRCADCPLRGFLPCGGPLGATPATGVS